MSSSFSSSCSSSSAPAPLLAASRAALSAGGTAISNAAFRSFPDMLQRSASLACRNLRLILFLTRSRARCCARIFSSFSSLMASHHSRAEIGYTGKTFDFLRLLFKKNFMSTSVVNGLRSAKPHFFCQILNAGRQKLFVVLCLLYSEFLFLVRDGL